LRQASGEKGDGEAAQSESWRKILLKAMPDPEHVEGAGRPIAAVNLGRTRADGLLALKVEQPSEAALAFLL
jgi:hypothetical protein